MGRRRDWPWRWRWRRGGAARRRPGGQLEGHPGRLAGAGDASQLRDRRSRSAPPFGSLVTFHEGGTVSEATASRGLRRWAAHLRAGHLGDTRAPDLYAEDDLADRVRHGAQPAGHARILRRLGQSSARRRSWPTMTISRRPARTRSTAPTARSTGPAVRRRRRRGSSRRAGAGGPARCAPALSRAGAERQLALRKASSIRDSLPVFAERLAVLE